MIKAKFSNSYRAKLARIKKLPQYYGDLMLSVRKRDAKLLIENFQSGIRDSTLGLMDLSSATTKIKSQEDMSQPDTPLYAYGDDEKYSLINALRMKPNKDGYTVYVSKAKHHRKRADGYTNAEDITLDHLFSIHEYGCIIPITDKMRYFMAKYKKIWFPRTKEVVRIPPRPSFFKAYQKTMLSIRNNKKETAKEVKQAVEAYIRMAKSDLMDKIIAEGKVKDWTETTE